MTTSPYQDKTNPWSSHSQILSYLHALPEKSKVLDVGTASGMLARRGNSSLRYFGIEANAEWATIASPFYERVWNSSFDEMQSEDLKGYDVIVLGDVLEHMVNPEIALKRLVELQDTGSLFVISVPNVANLWVRLHLLTGNFDYADRGILDRTHLRFFTRKSLIDLVGYSGLQIESIYPTPIPLELLSTFFYSKIGQIFHAMLANLTFLLPTVLGYQFVVSEKIMKQQNRSNIFIVLPAYNAAKTLKRTLDEIPIEFRKNIILVDDASKDETAEIAREAGLTVFVHPRNRGYGGNQKTCYTQALAAGADLVVMLHPDHQYDAKVIPQLVKPILNGEADAVFGSRMLGGHPLEGGMPWWKYNANVLLTALANLIFRRYLTEIHSGFRAYSKKYIETVRFMENSDDFIFDTEIIAQGMMNHLTFRETPIDTRYFPEASSINLRRSIVYGFGILKVLIEYWLHRNNIIRFKKFELNRS